MKNFSRPPAAPRASGRDRGGAPGDNTATNIFQLLNTGIALQRKGNLALAQESYRAILDFDPGHPDALHMMGLIALEAMRTVQAVEMLKRALARKPADPELLGSYAEALLRDNDPTTAERMLRRALKLAPDHPKLLCKLARCEAKLGREANAKQIFEALLARDPTFPAALMGYATLLLELGRREEASAHFKNALNLGIAPVRALAGLAECRVFEGNPPELTEIKKLLSRPAVRDSDVIKLLRAAAKICNDIGSYDEAFGHTMTIKRMVGPSGGKADYAARYRGMREIFTPEFFATHRGFGASSDIPVFIVGMPRSGTTLVEQIIASHPEAVAGGEIGAGRNIAVSLGYGRADQAEFARRINALTPKAAATHAREAVATLTRFSPNAVRITDKMPHNFEVLGLIALLFPRAKIVHCRRSPLDTCVSCFLTPLGDFHSYTEDLTTLGRYYRDYASLMHYWREVLPVPILDLDYESMIADPEEQSRRLIAFIGLEWDPACLDFRSAPRAVATASRSQVRRPIYDSSIGRWRRYEKHLGPLVTALGDLANQGAEITDLHTNKVPMAP